MKFIIPSETFVRLNNAAMPFGSEFRPALCCIRLENRAGNLLAIASTSFFIVVELIGPTDEPDGFVNISNDPAGALHIAAHMDHLEFETWPGVADMAVCHVYEQVIPVPVQSDKEFQFTNWFEFFKSLPVTRDKGFLFLDGELFGQMVASSPSGKICFPEFIDNTQIVLMTDAVDPAWVGITKGFDKDTDAKPSKLPEWLK